MAHLDRVATPRDSRCRLPVTRLRFECDAIDGLIPGAGDLVTLVPVCYLLYHGYRRRARRRMLRRRAPRSAPGIAAGAMPLLGDLFEMAFKSSRRNVALPRRECERRAVTAT